MKSASTDLENTDGNENGCHVGNINSKSLKYQLHQINKDTQLHNKVDQDYPDE